MRASRRRTRIESESERSIILSPCIVAPIGLICDVSEEVLIFRAPTPAESSRPLKVISGVATAIVSIVSDAVSIESMRWSFTVMLELEPNLKTPWRM